MAIGWYGKEVFKTFIKVFIILCIFMLLVVPLPPELYQYVPEVIQGRPILEYLMQYTDIWINLFIISIFITIIALSWKRI